MTMAWIRTVRIQAIGRRGDERLAGAQTPALSPARP
jgi:hypothetical protein